MFYGVFLDNQGKLKTSWVLDEVRCGKDLIKV